jgi:hypothetical protein
MGRGDGTKREGELMGSYSVICKGDEGDLPLAPFALYYEAGNLKRDFKRAFNSPLAIAAYGTFLNDSTSFALLTSHAAP